MLDRIQAKALTRPAFTPASSVIPGLSTTARISRPTGVNWNRTINELTTITVEAAIDSSRPLSGTEPRWRYTRWASPTMAGGGIVGVDPAMMRAT
jgi:hypothetical protein